MAKLAANAATNAEELIERVAAEVIDLAARAAYVELSAAVAAAARVQEWGLRGAAVLPVPHLRAWRAGPPALARKSPL